MPVVGRGVTQAEAGLGVMQKYCGSPVAERVCNLSTGSDAALADCNTGGTDGKAESAIDSSESPASASEGGDPRLATASELRTGSIGGGKLDTKLPPAEEASTELAVGFAVLREPQSEYLADSRGVPRHPPGLAE